MAIGTAPPRIVEHAELAPPPSGEERLVEQRLVHARRHIQRMELAQGLLTLAVVTLAYLLAAAVVDHWLVTGGLGFTGRMLFWLVWVAAGAAYTWRYVLPPLLRRVSLVYAADTIERSKPSLKNSLINFLLLRNERRAVPEVVYRALESRAASDLAQVEVESAVDGRPVLWRGYILTAVVAIFCLYLLISPKSPLISAVRVLWPWANVPAPTRVIIADVEPGNATAFHNDFVEISAEVQGARTDEQVLLYFSTADGQVSDQAVPMVLREGRYRAKLPPGSLGLQQDYRYYLAAGDCRSERYGIEVQIAPSIQVDSVHYDYPGYTRLDDRTAERRGDIAAIEGTKVTIAATANQPIRRAEIDLDCNGRQGLPMRVDQQRAAGSFTLRLSKEQPGQPEHESYQLRFTDKKNRLNPRPIRYRIEVVPDLPPLIEIVEPQQPEIMIPLDGEVVIRATAEDPDFALRQMVLRAEAAGSDLKLPPLLSQPAPGKAYNGKFDGHYVLRPGELELKPGTEVTYWFEAVDNKEPEANRTITEKRRIVIAGAAERREGEPGAQPSGQEPTPANPDQRPQDGAPRPQDANQEPGEASDAAQQPEGAAEQQAGDQPRGGEPNERNMQPGEKQPGENQPEDGTAGQGAQPGERQAGDSAAGNPSDPGDRGSENRGDAASDPTQNQPGDGQGAPPQPIDPEANPGDAIEQINKHRQQTQQQQQQQPPQDQLAQNEQQDPNPQQQPSQQQDGGGGGGQQQQQGAGQGQGQGDSQDAKGQSQGQGGKQGKQDGSGQSQAGSSQGQQQGANAGQNGDALAQGGRPQATGQKPDQRQEGGSVKPETGPSGGEPGDGQASGNHQPQDGAGGSGDASTNVPNQPQANPNSSDTNPQAGEGPTGKPDESQQNQPAGGQQTPPSAQSGGAGSQFPDSGSPNSDRPDGQQSGESKGGTPSANERQTGQQEGQGQEPRADAGGTGTGREAAQNTPQPGGQPQGKFEDPAQGQQPQAGQTRQHQPQEGDPQAGSQQKSGSGSEPQNAGSPTQPKPAGTDAAQSGDSAQKPETGGERPSGVTQQGAGEQKGSQPQPDGSQQQTADTGETNQRPGSPGAGERPENPGGTTQPQAGNQPREKSPDEQQQPGGSPQEAQSPSTSPKQSDSKSSTDGDRSGGGGKGGGQQANQPGQGSPGSQADAETGSGASSQQGSGETGSQPGEQVEAPANSGGQTVRRDGQTGEGSGKAEASDRVGQNAATPEQQAGTPGGASQPGTSNAPAGGNEPGRGQQSSATGQPQTGGQRGPDDELVHNEPRTPISDEANLEFARQQTNLALEHLRDQVEKPNSDLLNQLGWTPEEARRFIERWEQMQRSAERPGDRGEEAKNELNRALKSLGLRPRGTEIRGGGTRMDDVRGLQEAGRYAPPPDWAEHVREYYRGVAGGVE